MRKPADISGIYKIATEDKNEKTGSMTIKNISWQGFKLKISGYGYGIKEHDVQCNRYDQEHHQCLFAHNHLKVGDQITIEFFLDDPKMSFISRRVNIKWVQDDQFGVELQHPEDFEPSIRFYLLGLKTP